MERAGKILLASAIVAAAATNAYTAIAAGPALSGVQATNITSSSAQIIWTTDIPSDSHVDYGKISGSFGFMSENRCAGGAAYVVNHCAILPNLSPKTVYYYQVRSMDAGGAYNVLGTYQFVSASEIPVMPTPSAPILKAPQNAGIPVNLLWTGADPATSYNLYRRTPPVSGPWTLVANGLSGTSYSDQTAWQSTNYEYRIVACNNYGCSPDSNYANVFVDANGDTMPPTPPAGLAVVSLTTSSVTFSWHAATDNVGVVLYKIAKNGAFLTDIPAATRSFTDTAVSSSASYLYILTALDAAYNQSSQSSPLYVTIPAPPVPDTTPPNPSPSILLNSVSSSFVNFSWGNANDDTGVAGYKIFRNGLYLADATDTSFIDFGVRPNTLYKYFVMAYDAAGNQSLPGGTLSATTPTGNLGNAVPPPRTNPPTVLGVSINNREPLQRRLAPGSRGKDVKTLQIFLIKEGLLPQGSAGGYFGKLTRQAVIEFQEKYADELLRPSGFARGTGIVGLATRTKINGLLTKQTAPPPLP